MPKDLVTSETALEALYGAPVDRSLWKELDHVSAEHRALIEASPFVILSTVGPEGVDCSPRGDPAGFVRVEDPTTLLMPDRRGNNRLDSLRNIVRDPRVALLFLIPAKGETLRVIGRAEIDADPTLAARFEMNGKPPRTVLRIQVERSYFQCQKALSRSGLWRPEGWADPSGLPSAGDMLRATAPSPFDAERYDAAYPEHMRKTIY